MKQYTLSHTSNSQKIFWAFAALLIGSVMAAGLMRPAQALGDTEAPFVEVIYPTSADYVPKGVTVSIIVNATDNVEVTKIDYYVNGRLLCSIKGKVCDWKVPKKSATYNIEVRAFDADGNASITTQTVTSS